LYAIADGLKLSKRAAFWAILGCIWRYTLFVGASPTVTRAAVIGTVMVPRLRLERRSHAWTTLFAATWAMTFWDLGFHLSALATPRCLPWSAGR